MDEFETYEGLIDERYADVFYDGCFGETEDPLDYVDIKEVVGR